MFLDAESFSAANVSPLFFEGERQEIALREASELVTLTGEEDQKLSALYLNRDFASGLAIARLGGMFEDVGSTDLRYAAYQWAAAAPENPVLFVNLPAHGRSDPLTARQLKEVSDKRQLTLLAASQALASRSCLSETGGVIATGQSGGGRLAPDFATAAHELDWKVPALLGISVAGLDKRPSIATSAAFVADGFLAQYKYHRNAEDLKLDRGMGRFAAAMAEYGFRDTHNVLVNDYRIFRKDPSFFKMLFKGNPLSGDGGFEAIERAMDLNPDMHAAFVSGGLDKVIRWRKIVPQVRQLVNAYPERLTWEYWPEDGHSMGIGSQQPRFAACVRAVIESLSH